MILLFVTAEFGSLSVLILEISLCLFTSKNVLIVNKMHSLHSAVQFGQVLREYYMCTKKQNLH